MILDEGHRKHIRREGTQALRGMPARAPKSHLLCLEIIQKLQTLRVVLCTTFATSCSSIFKNGAGNLIMGDKK